MPSLPEQHYNIAKSESKYDHLGTFLRSNVGDPAKRVRGKALLSSSLPIPQQDFAGKLKHHLHRRVCSDFDDVNFAIGGNKPEDSILLKHDRIYWHSLMRVNHTTYDVRRDQDLLNPPRNHADVMTLAGTVSEDDSRHFRYARVVGVFHVNVVYVGPGMADYRPKRFDVLWVRWYGRSLSAAAERTGWEHRTLDRLSFPPTTEKDAFGFLDPGEVIRACHIVPVFSAGKANVGGRDWSKRAATQHDWKEYYVNR